MSVMDALEKKVKSERVQVRYSQYYSVIFNGMVVKTCLHHDKSPDEVIRMEDFSTQGKTNRPARQALVSMAHGLDLCTVEATTRLLLVQRWCLLTNFKNIEECLEHLDQDFIQW